MKIFQLPYGYINPFIVSSTVWSIGTTAVHVITASDVVGDLFIQNESSTVVLAWGFNSSITITNAMYIPINGYAVFTPFPPNLDLWMIAASTISVYVTQVAPHVF